METLKIMCPECYAGKHHNCDGVGGIDPHQEAVVEIPCGCMIAPHPHRREGEKEDLGQVVVDGILYLRSQQVDNRTREITQERLDPSPGIGAPSFVPEEDPGVLGEAFPELDDDGPGPRLKADASLIPDLYDVEVQNHHGEWVPMVPMPIHIGFGIKQCHCGVYRLGKRRYQEHYAYAHILGMAK